MLIPMLVAACLVQGSVLDTTGQPVAGAAVFAAATGDSLGVTGPDGKFSLAADAAATDPATGAAGSDAAILKFRRENYFPAVETIPCGTQAYVVRMIPTVFEMETQRFSATRLARPWESSPVQEEAVDLESLRDAEGAGPSIAQAVQQLPGVGAVGRDGFTSAPTIRGFGRDRSLILLEGVRLSSDRGIGPTASFLDPYLLRDLSVVRGASGVAYGSGAMGGVISTGLGAAGTTRDFSAKISGATNESGLLTAARVREPLGDWRSALSGYFRTQDDYEFPGGDELDGGDAVNSGFDAYGGALVLERDVREGALRIATTASFAEDIGRPTTRGGRLDTIESEEHLLASVRWSRDDGTRRTEFGFGWHQPETINRAERFHDSGTHSRIGRTVNDSDDFSLNALIERPIGEDAQAAWLAGVDAFSRVGVDAVETNVFFTEDDPPTTSEPQAVQLMANATRLDAGAFAGWKRSIRDLGEVLVAGRVDFAARGADGRSDADWVAPSLTAGAVFPIADRWALVGQAARSFRAPRLQELYFEGDRPAGSRLANPDLEPETAWSLEVGTRYANGPWTGDFAVWGMLADDLIVQLPVDAEGDTLRNFNENEGKLAGAELSIGWKDADGRARTMLQYAFMYGENEDGDPLPDIPPGEVRLTGDVRAARWSDGREARFRATFRAGAAKTPTGIEARWYSGLLGETDTGGDEVGVPGFGRLDLGARVGVWNRAVVDVAVTNALDARYLDRPENGAYPQPGRSLRVALLWN